MGNNPLRFIDPDGNFEVDFDWIFDEQEDGSYKRREGVVNDGGENFHTYINRDGTGYTYDVKTGNLNSFNQNEINKNVEIYLQPRVYQLGITGSNANGAGGLFSAGIAWDSDGNTGFYNTEGIQVGYDKSFGIEFTYTKSHVLDSNFGVNNLNGSGYNYNGGISYFDFSRGGDASGFNLLRNIPETYNSTTFGLSTPGLGGSVSYEHTRFSKHSWFGLNRLIGGK